MQRHPVNQVGQLAEPAADAHRHRPLGELHPGQKTAAGRGAADALPEREGFSRLDAQAIEAGGRQPQIHHLVVLQLRIGAAEPAQQQGSVTDDPHRQRLGGLPLRKAHPTPPVLPAARPTQLVDAQRTQEGAEAGEGGSHEKAPW